MISYFASLLPASDCFIWIIQSDRQCWNCKDGVYSECEASPRRSWKMQTITMIKARAPGPPLCVPTQPRVETIAIQNNASSCGRWLRWFVRRVYWMVRGYAPYTVTLVSSQQSICGNITTQWLLMWSKWQTLILQHSKMHWCRLL